MGRKELKVLWTVIVSDLVFVVNSFSRGKMATNDLLHHDNMFAHIAALVGSRMIGQLDLLVTAIGYYVALACAFVVRWLACGRCVVADG